MIENFNIVTSYIEGPFERYDITAFDFTINVSAIYCNEYFNLIYKKHDGLSDQWSTSYYDILSDDWQSLMLRIASIEGLGYHSIISEIDDLTLAVRLPLQDRIERFLNEVPK